MNETFEGFPQPKKNYFSLPNEMINIIAHITNMSELKVIIYVIRHTWGFQEFGICKTISTDEFMHGRRFSNGKRMDEGTGLSHHSVIDGLRAAEDHGYLICDTDTSDKARTTKSYMLKMALPPSEDSSEAPSAESSEGGVQNLQRPPVQNLQSRCAESSDRSEKDTKEKQLRKTYERKGGERVHKSDDEEKSPDSPPELTPIQKIVKRTNEIRHLFNTAMGTTVVWNKDNQEGAKDLAEAEKTDEDILLTIKDIQEDSDPFDLKQINLKLVAKRIDGRLKARELRQSRPPQQQFPPTQAKPQFRKPTLMPTGVSPGPMLDLDAISERQMREWIELHGEEHGITLEAVGIGEAR
jgi:hypothetical protein